MAAKARSCSGVGSPTIIVRSSSLRYPSMFAPAPLTSTSPAWMPCPLTKPCGIAVERPATNIAMNPVSSAPRGRQPGISRTISKSVSFAGGV